MAIINLIRKVQKRNDECLPNHQGTKTHQLALFKCFFFHLLSFFHFQCQRHSKRFWNRFWVRYFRSYHFQRNFFRRENQAQRQRNEQIEHFPSQEFSQENQRFGIRSRPSCYYRRWYDWYWSYLEKRSWGDFTEFLLPLLILQKLSIFHFLGPQKIWCQGMPCFGHAWSFFGRINANFTCQ